MTTTEGDEKIYKSVLHILVYDFTLRYDVTGTSSWEVKAKIRWKYVEDFQTTEIN